MRGGADVKLAEDFDDIISMLEWRKQSLLDLVDVLKPYNKTTKEYLIRVKELDWLISKFKQKVKQW